MFFEALVGEWLQQVVAAAAVLVEVVGEQVAIAGVWEEHLWCCGRSLMIPL